MFDFGGVVVNWDTDNLFREFFADPVDLAKFYATAFTPEQNRRLDLGMPIADLVADLTSHYPHYADALAAWRDRWIETVPTVIDGTEALMSDLRDAGILLLGCSNFSTETFAWTRQRYSVFEQFDDIVLSGALGIAKPDHGIFAELCSRNQVSPHEVVFFDDLEANIISARAFGMTAELFRTAAKARQDLIIHGVLGADA